MAIYLKDKPVTVYKGFYKPVNIYDKDKKVAGWKNKTQTGDNLTFTDTYNDTADVVIKGNSVVQDEQVFDASGTVKSRCKNLFNIGEVGDYTVYAPSITQLQINKENFELSGIVQGGAQSWVFRNELCEYNGGYITASGTFSGIVRWLFRLYDENGVNISNGNTVTGATYNAVYNAFYAAISPFTFSVSNPDVKYIQIGFVFHHSIGVGTRQYLIKPQLEVGTVATSFEPYFGEPTTAIIPTLRKVGDVADEFILKSGKITRKIGVIESYNGETITTDYISTTGGLDTGAEVRYVLPEPIEEQIEPQTLPTYPQTTIIETQNNTISELETTATVKVIDKTI